MLSGLIEIVLNGRYKFKTFKLGCADSESKEVRKIRDYITATYKLISAENADMEIYIGKTDNIWDMGVRLTPRPLSLRDYRVANIEGGLNPTIAYAINTFCNLDLMHSYLNIFSGSGTLLIEAGRLNDKLKLVGFDINGKSNALAVQNIKKAGQIRLIQLKTADIFNRPDLGKFDVITSDLPFGMKIYKNNNLNKLYQCFVNYSEEILNKKGVLVVYTTEYKLLNAILQKSKFAIVKTLDLKVPTSISASFIYPKIFVCNLK
jgi:23S rRNA G2445 N2-methylase RlmL